MQLCDGIVTGGPGPGGQSRNETVPASTGQRGIGSAAGAGRGYVMCMCCVQVGTLRVYQIIVKCGHVDSSSRPDSSFSPLTSLKWAYRCKSNISLSLSLSLSLSRKPVPTQVLVGTVPPRTKVRVCSVASRQSPLSRSHARILLSNLGRTLPTFSRGEKKTNCRTVRRCCFSVPM